MRLFEPRQAPPSSSESFSPTPTSSSAFDPGASTSYPPGETSQPITTADPNSTPSSSESPTSRIWTITDNNGKPTVVTLPPIPGATGGPSSSPTTTGLVSSSGSHKPSSSTASHTVPAAAAASTTHAASSSGLKHTYLLVAILVPILVVFLLLPLSILGLWCYRRRRRPDREGRSQKTTSRQHLRSESGGSHAGARTPTPMEMSQYDDYGITSRNSMRSKTPDVNSRLTEDAMTPRLHSLDSRRESSNAKRGMGEFDLGFRFHDGTSRSSKAAYGRPSMERSTSRPHAETKRDSQMSGGDGLGIGVAHGGNSWYVENKAANGDGPHGVRVSNEDPVRRSEIASFDAVSPSDERDSRFDYHAIRRSEVTPHNNPVVSPLDERGNSMFNTGRDSGWTDVISPISERNSRADGVSRFNRRSDAQGADPVSPIAENEYSSRARGKRRSNKSLPVPPSDVRPESDLLPGHLPSPPVPRDAAPGAGRKRRSKRNSTSPPKLTSANLTAHRVNGTDHRRSGSGHGSHSPPRQESPFSHPDDDDRSVSDVSGIGERDPDEVSFVSSLGAEELERRKSERSLKRVISNKQGKKTGAAGAPSESS
ncbi:MAG: hypothetical protein Q9227_000567 [Pyrenula ochraceoflavens]